MKVIAGTFRPDRDETPAVEMPLVDEIPPAPDWLPNVHAVKEYDRLSNVLMNTGLLTQGGVMVLAHLCALHGKIVQMWAAGTLPTGHLMAQYIKLQNDFGLTPVAQGKVKRLANNENKNPYEGRPQRPAAGNKKKAAKKKG